jgi:hypothetical protein
MARSTVRIWQLPDATDDGPRRCPSIGLERHRSGHHRLMEATRAVVPSAARPWLIVSMAAAALALAGSAIALVAQELYAELTPAFRAQALAQDIVNLLVVSPAMLLLAVLAMRGSASAYVLWLGTLLFTSYNYLIYTVAIPFDALFLLWVAVLGLALFALLGGAACIDRSEILVAYRDARAARVAAWALILIALLFGALWLSEDVPAIGSGTAPPSLIEQGIITNPVHVLDLAFFLPATVLIGALWLRGSARAGAMAPAFLAFLLLTGLPIIVTPVVQTVRGESAAWPVVLPIGIVTIVVLALLRWLLVSTTSTAKPDGPSPPVVGREDRGRR